MCIVGCRIRWFSPTEFVGERNAHFQDSPLVLTHLLPRPLGKGGLHEYFTSEIYWDFGRRCWHRSGTEFCTPAPTCGTGYSPWSRWGVSSITAADSTYHCHSIWHNHPLLFPRSGRGRS